MSDGILERIVRREVERLLGLASKGADGLIPPGPDDVVVRMMPGVKKPLWNKPVRSVRRKKLHLES